MLILLFTKKPLVWGKLNKKVLFILIFFEIDVFYNIQKLVLECGVEDPEACLHWCQRIGLFAEIRACSKYCRNMTLSKRNGTAAAMRWRCRKCIKEFSLTNGTVFEESRLPLGHALLLMVYWSVPRHAWIG